ncbi:WD40 repeat domain-containing protein [Aspergillus affinis]|uniref:WD40 repeat domain-containing protein n=1 Tax=Aspergillus affinis TaxID=1070780 RepID=UPI0022FEEA76|nr:WD40 repeat-like protein [Aspergillus affinis]KAI9035457.1 WD40 repeat-like protein [Aspergillus affinis]
MEDGTIEIRHTTTWTLIQIFKCSDSVRDLMFLPDGQVLISAAQMGDVSLWDITPGMQQHAQEHISRPHSDIVNYVAFSPTGQHAASCANDGTMVLWYSKTRSILHTRKDGSYYTSVIFSPDGKPLATHSGGFNRIWNLDMEQVAKVPTQSTYSVFEGTSWKDGLAVINHRVRPRMPAPPQPKAVEYNWEDNGWIVRAYGSERLVWRPPECRPHGGSSYAVNDQTLVSGTDSGQVFWISFQLGDVSPS